VAVSGVFFFDMGCNECARATRKKKRPPNSKEENKIPENYDILLIGS